MAQVYRDIYLNIGFSLFPTGFSNNTLEVKTENNASRLVITFATEYIDYVKTVDIFYTGSDLETHIKTYALGTAIVDSVEHPVFIIPREITFGEYALIQFRASWPIGVTTPLQETVDPTILRLRFKPSIKTEDLDIIGTYPDPLFNIILDFIRQNAMSGFSGWSGEASTLADLSYHRRTGTTRERWYTLPCTTDAMGVSTGLDANTIYAHIFISSKTITIDTIAINCTNGAVGRAMRIGIYNDNNGEPGTLLLDAGEVLTATNGVKSIAIAGGQILTGGRLYWFVGLSNNITHAFRVPALASIINVIGTDNTLGVAGITHFYAAQAYGALPASFPSPTNGLTKTFPAIFVRLSA